MSQIDLKPEEAQLEPVFEKLAEAVVAILESDDLGQNKHDSWLFTFDRDQDGQITNVSCEPINKEVTP